jgi:molecular chaperone GrpE
MTEHDQQRPKIKVTDRRRVRPDPDPDATAEPREGAVGGSGGSEASAASRGSEAPPATAGPRPQPVDADVSELEAARREAAEYRDHLQRLAAEFENYRKRVLKEQTRAVELASEPVIRRLLEVLDEFDLALMAAERKPDFDRFLHGVELVYAKLAEILRSEGLEAIEAMGKPFDPERHEALMQSEGGDGDGELTVADVLRRGYTLKGRVVRPAGVRVARK